MADTKHMKLLGNVWFLRLPIPPELGHHFPVDAQRKGRGRPGTAGRFKDRVVESLGSGDVRVAQARRDARRAHWRAYFARLASGLLVDDSALQQASQGAYS